MNPSVYGQQAWQPTRVPPQATARPLNSSTHPTANTNSNQPASGTQSTTTVLRWHSVRQSPITSTTGSTPSASSKQVVATGHTQPIPASRTNGSTSQVVTANDQQSNPLRQSRAVRQVTYQVGAQDNAGQLPDGLPELPRFPSEAPQQNDPVDPQAVDLPAINPPAADNAAGNSAESQPDPLSEQEQAPVPYGNDLRANPRSATDGSASDQEPAADPFPRNQGQDAFDKSLEPTPQDDLSIPQNNRDSQSASCNQLRDKMRQAKLSDIDLNVSPDFGGGLRSDSDSKKERLDFAASSPVRQWIDNRGNIVASGRLIDLRDDRVVLDVNGREQLIPLRDLSDIDIDYVGRAWNLPMRCGVGFEEFAGRQFIPSAAEWKASGLCHKPLYYEEVQLERYGHEAGPLIQPLVSSAHFFTNTLILPYKMGIHPMNECQYPLGYYRPGSCAPYMIPAVPFSLRGAAAQAGAIAGASALIP